MKKLLHYLANRRRPDTQDDGVFAWTVTKMFGLSVQLVLLYKSEEPDDFRPMDVPDQYWISLHGSYLARSKAKPAATIIHQDQVDALAVRKYPRDYAFNIELPPAKDFAESMLRFNWMSVTELVFDARKPLWLLVVQRA